MSLLDQMTKFVESHGDCIRFDTYMQEHLFNEKSGFYEHIEIGENGDFSTRAAHPMYAILMDLFLEEHRLVCGDFLEIGGGDGAFKRNYLKLSPSTNYISVDASRLLVAQQGDNSLFGLATDLPLPSNSVEGAVFSNELIDALPARVLKIRNEDGEIRIDEEGYVTNDGQSLNFEFREAERDDFVETYETFLREERPNVGDGAIISVSPDTVKAVSEMHRVLKRGKVILVDYGFHDAADPAFCRKTQEFPFFAQKGRYHGVKEILQRPYEVDITYKVDFDFLSWVGGRVGFSSVDFDYQHFWSGKIMRENGLLYNGIPDPRRFPEDSSMFIAYRDFMVLELGK